MLIKSNLVPQARDEQALAKGEDDRKNQERVAGCRNQTLTDPLTTVPDEENAEDDRKSKGLQKFSEKYGQNPSFSDVTEITPHLFLCGAVALRGNTLQDLNVTCVINATRELPDTPLPTHPERDILYLRVNVDDKKDSDILQWLDVVTDIIYQVKMAGGRTLIHCVAGISRSATLCLAYLIRCEGYTLHDSYVRLKDLRHTIRPNAGFFGQLVEFEKRVTGKQTVFMIRSDYTHSFIPQLYEEDFRRFYTRHPRLESS